jgi:hypothetical protein
MRIKKAQSYKDRLVRVRVSLNDEVGFDSVLLENQNPLWRATRDLWRCKQGTVSGPEARLNMDISHATGQEGCGRLLLRSKSFQLLRGRSVCGANLVWHLNVEFLEYNLESSCSDT